MKVGRLAPRHQSMALLYPGSKNLQSHVSEYFIVVVRLCHQLLKITKKSTIGQFASTLSDADLKTFQLELDLWANSIKEEESLLLARRIGAEAEENSRIRAISSQFFDSLSLERKLKESYECSIFALLMIMRQFGSRLERPEIQIYSIHLRNTKTGKDNQIPVHFFTLAS
jgi:hypothetical protein